MINKIAVAITAIILLIVGLLMAVAFHYYGKTISQQTEISAATVLADTRLKTINSMAEQQQAVAYIDAKYTQELSDAQKTISDLRADVDSGTKQLRVNATCTKRMPKTTGTSGVDDATIPRLTDSAQRDYFTLRERINTASKQIAGLQDYIRQIEEARQK